MFSARDEMSAKASRENFPVALRLLPRDVRTNLMAIYGFARFTDDIGDEAEGAGLRRPRRSSRVPAALTHDSET